MCPRVLDIAQSRIVIARHFKASRSFFLFHYRRREKERKKRERERKGRDYSRSCGFLIKSVPSQRNLIKNSTVTGAVPGVDFN